MNKKQKGTTLVEVLVSIAVFAILSVAIISCLLGMTKIVTRQEEYVRFGMILSDMSFRYSEYTSSGNADEKTIFYTDQFVETTNPNKYFYQLKYKVTDGVFKIVEVKQIKSQRIIIQNVDIPNNSEVHHEK